MPTAHTNADATCEPRLVRPLAAIRNEIAIVRSLADEVERLVPSTSPPMAMEQLTEELARLGGQLLEAASTLRASAYERSSRDASLAAVA